MTGPESTEASCIIYFGCLDSPNEVTCRCVIVTGKILACVAAVIGAAVLTLATMLALVQGSILAVSIVNLPLRMLAGTI